MKNLNISSRAVITKNMIDSSYYLPPDRAGGIYRHVIDYPNGKLAGAEDYFYWEKINFGQEPTARINHVTIFPNGYGFVKLLIVNKQLYASRYIRVALQMFYCIPDSENPSKPGFYLLEVNDSRLPDFGGLKLKPAALKGTFVKSAHISATMSPSIRLAV